MQSVCTLLPEEFAQRIVDARAQMAEEPSIGVIYDPPFAHFTQQLAEEYDWDGLSAAMAEFAAKEEPFDVPTLGVWIGGNGEFADAAVIPLANEQMRDLHERLWRVVTPFAQGNVNDFYAPENWFPHVTIKRCGTDHEAFGRAMARLVDTSFRWTFTVDNVSVQHDPGKNSRTHYLRLRFPLGGGHGTPVGAGDTNGAVTELTEAGAGVWRAAVTLDGGGQIEHEWTAPEMVRAMASLKCSNVHFQGGRCRVEAGRIVTLEPNTPHPLLS